jgi:PAS domain S-box-containing protein
MAGKEIFWEQDYILSETDEKGVITFASKSFVDVCGYSQEELLGAPHNIVRHPDMPRAAFKMVWDDIQTKGFWRGIVKNLAKNGDYYWVEAMILRNIDNSGKISYFSVRTKPSREQIKDASALYATLH